MYFVLKTRKLDSAHKAHQAFTKYSNEKTRLKKIEPFCKGFSSRKIEPFALTTIGEKNGPDLYNLHDLYSCALDL